MWTPYTICLFLVFFFYNMNTFLTKSISDGEIKSKRNLITYKTQYFHFYFLFFIYLFIYLIFNFNFNFILFLFLFFFDLAADFS